jgi:hypothetical protein
MESQMKIQLDLTPAQIDLLREGLDELPLAKYITLIVPLLDQLPFTESDVAAALGNADSAPPAPLASRELGGGFGLTAYTPRGVSMLDALERVLSPIGTVTECSICRREHGHEVIHEAE